MTHPADSLFQSSYRLDRIPQDPSLQAWSAADDLFLERFPPDGHALLLLNDPFGALAVALHDQPLQWWHASAMAREALEKNCATNKVPVPSILDHPEKAAISRAIALHIPKSVNYFAWLLEQSVHRLEPGQCVYALGMVKHISAGHIAVMNRLFDRVNPGRAVKKARVIELSMPTQIQVSKTSQYQIQPNGFTLQQLPGCFAENRPDPGALAFLDYFQKVPFGKRVLDLGCGNGILGLAYAQLHPQAQVWMVDDNLQALESARQNWQANELPGPLMTCHSNGLNALSPDQPFDVILCNPPFHQETTITEEIACKLFGDARKHLCPGGELWIVANRHMHYSSDLNRRFKSVELISKHPKFVVLRCIAD